MRAKLDEFIRKFYKNELVKGAFYSAIILSSFFILCIILEYFGRFDTAVRTGIFYTLIAAFVIVLGRFFVLPMLRLNKIGKTISYEDSAKILVKELHLCILRHTYRVDNIRHNYDTLEDLL